MIAELSRITDELTDKGYVLTSFGRLSVPFDPSLVGELCAAAAEGTFSKSAADLTKHIEKSNMTIVQDERALELGRTLVRPVVAAVFGENPAAMQNWSLYAMNHYQRPGATLGAHQDTVGSTVMVVSVSGARDFTIYEQSTYPSQQTAEKETFRVEPGSIVILDAYADPLHSVTCVEGPSVSAVLDVPDMLRPAETYYINQ